LKRGRKKEEEPHGIDPAVALNLSVVSKILIA
jgi:hypothetical protein